MSENSTGMGKWLGIILLIGLVVFGVSKCGGTDEPQIKVDQHSTTVTGLKELNRLVVYRAYITSVTTARDRGVIFDSTQAMITPAYVNYFIDFSKLGVQSVTFKDNKVMVKLPPLMIERANIDTRRVLIFNDGILTNMSGTHEKLRRANNKIVYVQLRKAADQSSLVKAARRQAQVVVLNHVRRILDESGSGRPAISVTF